MDMDASWLAASQPGGKAYVLDLRTGFMLNKLKLSDSDIQQVHLCSCSHTVCMYVCMYVCMRMHIAHQKINKYIYI